MDRRVGRIGTAILGVFVTIAVLCVSVPSRGQTLWRVKPANDSIHTSYILGTMHIADASVLDTLGGFGQALENVSAVYAEIDAADLSAMPSLLALAKAPADSTLLRILSPEQRDTLVRHIAAAGLDGVAILRGFDVFKPAMLDIYLEMQRAARHGSPVQPMDIAIQRRAIAKGKEVRALESAAQQMSLLVGGPVAVQLGALMGNVCEAEDAQALTDELVAAYRRQDLAALGRLLSGSMTVEYAERMVYGRNRAWVVTLAPVMLHESILVAVGAGHLVGQEGLLSLLRGQGFEVTPVCGSVPPPGQKR